MSGHEAGANVVDAHGAGQDAESYAAGFSGLGLDFDDALQEAKTACQNDPEVTGWSQYGDDQAEAISSVERHGISIGENVQGGASEISRTDEEASEIIGETEANLPRELNF